MAHQRRRDARQLPIRLPSRDRERQRIGPRTPHPDNIRMTPTPAMISRQSALDMSESITEIDGRTGIPTPPSDVLLLSSFGFRVFTRPPSLFTFSPAPSPSPRRSIQRGKLSTRPYLPSSFGFRSSDFGFQPEGLPPSPRIRNGEVSSIPATLPPDLHSDFGFQPERLQTMQTRHVTPEVVDSCLEMLALHFSTARIKAEGRPKSTASPAPIISSAPCPARDLLRENTKMRRRRNPG